jgi:FtsP/CotA-like multicopper oxidase with cupredoxin domain
MRFKFSMRIPLRLLLVFAVCAASAARAGDALEKSFALDIVRGAVAADQRVLRVEKGDAVRLRVTSDAPGELHLHGYRLEVKLAPGAPAELAFTAHATGRYPFEWHAAGAAAKPGAHHGPPLAALEVRPK